MAQRTALTCALDEAARPLAADAVDRGGMSVRGVHRALRVPRTYEGRRLPVR